MSKKITYPETSDWNWREETTFAQTVVVEDQVFISGQQTLDSNGEILDPGDIAAQTRNVFENMKTALAQVGLELSDLVRLNTYYVYDGADEDATEYWENMTRVRLEYFPDPGPAATAVRIKGMPYRGQLIQIEGVALKGESRKTRQRIMPAGSWDWSIAVPLSQGWKIGERIFVGGQISADEKGASVHVGDLEAQTRNIYKYIGNVLKEAGSSFDDIVRIKICFKHDSRDSSGTSFVDRIMHISTEFAGKTGAALTAFGVDLLYPGLDLEIDAMAIVDPDRQSLSCSDLGGSYQPDVFSHGVSAAGEIYVAGQTALDEHGSAMCVGDFAGQARIIFDRLKRVLAEADASLEDVVKLNLFFVNDGDDVAEPFHAVSRIWAEIAPNAHPAMTPVRVHELARPELMLQADCVALK
jgi:enamine deaminase RidA (YjgF/YER057c/UK114 family)